MDNKNTLKKSFSDLTRFEREAIAQRAVQQAISRMHAKGISTVEVDETGKRYLHHPNGTLTPIEDETNTTTQS